MDKLKVAVASITSIDNVDENFRIIEKLTLQARAKKAKIIFFPENCLFMRVKERTEIVSFQKDSVIINKIQKLAAINKMTIHLGSVSFNLNNKNYNSSLLFDSAGRLTVSYSKIHLFDIKLKGHDPIKESDVFTPGTVPSIFTYQNWKFGQSICYDIRFSELYLKYFEKKVDVILIPAAFLKKTGECHWHILNRARAIENQCYVISSAQSGIHKSKMYKGMSRETYGHSLIVDPWGRIEVDLNKPNNIQIFSLERDKITQVREQIPMVQHRRNRVLSKSFFSLKIK